MARKCCAAAGSRDRFHSPVFEFALLNDDFSLDATAAYFCGVAPAAASLSLRSRSVFSSRRRRSSSAASCAIVLVRSTAAARWPTVKVRLILETMMSIYVSGSRNMVIGTRIHNAWLPFAARVDRPIEATGVHRH
jgi:hypothetical protein